MMTRAKYKLCRRLGSQVFEKCQTPKFVQSESRRGKGRAGSKRPKALSIFGSQLVEKQKVRFAYGLSEKQFSNYVKKASHVKGMAVADKLFEEIETRIDNVVYRLGLAHTRALARQMVSHGHFTVNGRKTTIPSLQVSVGDEISVREGSRKSVLFSDIGAKLKNYTSPAWLSFNADNLTGKVITKPVKKDTENFFDYNAVLEYYSR